MRKRPQSRLQQLAIWGGFIREQPPAPTTLISPTFNGSFVRIVIIDGEPWWALADVAKILSYRDATHAAREVRDRHKGYTPVCTPGGSQVMAIVSKSGLFRLMMRSDGAVAEAFQDWITDEVLPEIDRTGTYSVQNSRVAREARRLNCDTETAKVRCGQFATNKDLARDAVNEGGGPRDIQAIHNAIYLGMFGNTAKGLRPKVGQKSYRETPLNRMGVSALSTNQHTKVLFAEKCKALGGNLPLAAREVIAFDIAQQLTKEGLAKIGTDYHFGVRDDPKRGKIIDLVRSELAADSTPKEITS